MSANRQLTDARPTANHRASDGRPFSRKIDRQGSRVLNVGGAGGLDGNSREARFIRAYEAELVRHLGGSPSFVQRQQIVRAARLALHLQLWDEASIPKGGAIVATAHAHNTYIAWSNNLSRLLRDIGIEPASAAPVGRTLADLRREAREAAA